MWKTAPADVRGNAATVYFGGGTPSLLPPQSVETILLALDKFYGLGADTEITFEANPGTLDKKGLQQLKAMGVNRLSLGAQSFDPEILAMLGPHSWGRMRRSGQLNRRTVPVLKISAWI